MTSKVDILWPWELPEKIDGTAIVIDILAATSNISWFLTHEVRKLVIVNSSNVDKARGKYKDALIIGESDDPRFRNYFFSSNSPAEIEKVDVKDKVILYMSNNGSKVIEEAINRQAQKVLTVSFNNIEAVGVLFRSLGFVGPVSRVSQSSIQVHRIQAPTYNSSHRRSEGEPRFGSPSLLPPAKSGTKSSLPANSQSNNFYIIPAGEVTPDIFPDRKSKDDLLFAETFKDYLVEEKVDWKKTIINVSSVIRLYYPYEEGQRERDIEIITKLNINPVVPVCRKGEDGFIYVSPL